MSRSHKPAANHPFSRDNNRDWAKRKHAYTVTQDLSCGVDFALEIERARKWFDDALPAMRTAALEMGETLRRNAWGYDRP